MIMFPSAKIATAILSLMPLTAVLGQCKDSDRVCLTSFRWCDSSPCDFPPGIYPQHDSLDRNVGYAMIRENRDYELTWENAPDEVEIRWNVARGRWRQSAVWSKSTSKPPSLCVLFCHVLKEYVPTDRRFRRHR